MGTITFQVAEAGFSTATKSYTVPDSNIDRVVVAYQIPANASINGTATRGQVLAYWAGLLMQETIQAVLAYEKAAAEAAADATVTPITAT